MSGIASPKGSSAKKAKGARKKSKGPGQVKVCDSLFGQIIRSSGRCVGRCNGQPKGALQAAHGFSRRYRAVRWDERNCFPLCQGCHLYWTLRPLEWDEWMRARMGEALYAELRDLALNGRNPDLKATAARLRERLDQVEQGRAA
jgi:hypothetical protein